MRVLRTSALSIAVSAALLAGGTLAVSGCGGGKTAHEATPAEVEQDEEAALHREEQAEAAQQREALSVIESKQREEEAETNAETTLATAKARAKKREKAAEERIKKLERELAAKKPPPTTSTTTTTKSNRKQSPPQREKTVSAEGVHGSH